MILFIHCVPATSNLACSLQSISAGFALAYAAAVAPLHHLISSVVFNTSSFAVLSPARCALTHAAAG
jgi:hypothetical protein